MCKPEIGVSFHVDKVNTCQEQSVLVPKNYKLIVTLPKYSYCALNPNRVTFAISHRKKVARVLERPQFSFNQMLLNCVRTIFTENFNSVGAFEND